jgi:hypothetical protein
MLKRTLVIDPTRLLDAVSHSPLESLDAPLGECDTDDGDVKCSAFHHRVKRWEDHLVGKIAGHAVDHKSIGLGSAHQALSFLAADIS